MKYTLLFVFILTISSVSFSQNLFSDSNLLPWCIVPFDNQERTPEQRIDMLIRVIKMDKFNQNLHMIL
jgi:hypothetical protein